MHPLDFHYKKIYCRRRFISDPVTMMICTECELSSSQSPLQRQGGGRMQPIQSNVWRHRSNAYLQTPSDRRVVWGWTAASAAMIAVLVVFSPIPARAQPSGVPLSMSPNCVDSNGK